MSNQATTQQLLEGERSGTIRENFVGLLLRNRIAFSVSKFLSKATKLEHHMMQATVVQEVFIKVFQGNVKRPVHHVNTFVVLRDDQMRSGGSNSNTG